LLKEADVGDDIADCAAWRVRDSASAESAKPTGTLIRRPAQTVTNRRLMFMALAGG